MALKGLQKLRAEQISALLKSTLHDLAVLTNSYGGVDVDNARSIMLGFLNPITDEAVARYFIDYCFENFTITINRKQK